MQLSRLFGILLMSRQSKGMQLSDRALQDKRERGETWSRAVKIVSEETALGRALRDRKLQVADSKKQSFVTAGE